MALVDGAAAAAAAVDALQVHLPFAKLAVCLTPIAALNTAAQLGSLSLLPAGFHAVCLQIA
jgi:hypothetical protein